jgi:hypothetical protein
MALTHSITLTAIPIMTELPMPLRATMAIPAVYRHLPCLVPVMQTAMDYWMDMILSPEQ